MHIHDNDGKQDEHLPVGMGKINWNPIWDELVKLPVIPNIVLEYNKAELFQIIKTAEEVEEKVTARRFVCANQGDGSGGFKNRGDGS